MSNPNSVAIRRRILGLALRNARQAEGRSLEDVASTLQITADQVARYERGEDDISLPELEAMASYLDVPPTQLLVGALVPRKETASPAARQLRNKIIGTLLRQARLGASKSVEDVASVLGCSVDALGQFERGIEPVPAIYLDMLASSLSVPFSQFLTPASPAAAEPSGLAHLSDEVRAFVSDSGNFPFLKVAMALSEMTPEELGHIGRALAAADSSGTSS